MTQDKIDEALKRYYHAAHLAGMHSLIQMTRQIADGMENTSPQEKFSVKAIRDCARRIEIELARLGTPEYNNVAAAEEQLRACLPRVPAPVRWILEKLFTPLEAR